MRHVGLMAGLIALTTGVVLGPGYGAPADYGLPGEYLQYDVSARAAGMGGAMTGLADDGSAMFYNPAGLARLSGYQAGLEHFILFGESMFDAATFSMPVRGAGRVGIGAVALYSPGLDVRDGSYNPGGVPNWAGQGALVVSYAGSLTPGFSVGVSAKGVFASLFGHNGFGTGVDVGALASFLPELQAGLYLSNLFEPQVLGETYPGTAVLGVAGKFLNSALLVDADLSKSFMNQGFKWQVGGEFAIFNNLFFVRAGTDDELRLHAGLGLLWDGFAVDYAANIDATGLTHNISLGYRWGEGK